MTLSKDTTEFIDRICEDSVNHPAEFDNWPFKTFEERQKENNEIARVASFIMGTYVGEDVDPILEVVSGHQKMLESVTWILKQMQRHLLNIDKRLYALEERPSGKKITPKYK